MSRSFGVQMLTFNQIIGHERQLSLLRRLIRNQTIVGTYLFCGPENVGKETTAMALAMALLCEHTESLGCGVCKACSEVQSGTHPDLIVLSPQGASQSIKIDSIEGLRHRFQLSSFHGGWKVGIIREAHTLHYQSAPALLKILEEPPQRAVFILISHREEQVIPTLRSRAKIVPFFPLSRELIEKALAGEWKGDLAAREALLQFSAGRLGMVYRILRGDFLSRRDKILTFLVGVSLSSFGSVLETVDGLMALTKNPQVPAGQTDQTEAREEQRRLERELLLVLQSLLRDIWILGKSPEAVLNTDRTDRLKKLARSWEKFPLSGALAALENAGRDLELNVSLRLILERIFTALGAKEPLKV